MNTSEIKLDLFRKIDNLKDAELERIYQALISLLAPSKKHTLIDTEKKAIEEALECNKNGEIYTHESVMREAQGKYQNLKFK